ncbi:MAG: NADH-quinone oxidoreductase subunit L [Cytophagales bacterium]
MIDLFWIGGSSFLFFLLNFFFKPDKNKTLILASIIGSVLTTLFALFSFVSLNKFEQVYFNWFSVGAFDFNVGFELSNFSFLIATVVLLVSTAVQVYSFHYMRKELLMNKYFAYLNLFAFAMLTIVYCKNLMVIFLAWELMGVASYLLIGFWFKNELAVKASKKAFLVNKLGDLGLMTAIMMLLIRFKTLDLMQLTAMTNQTANFLSPFELDLIGILLFCGCIAKSAQFPLSIWLPDAMKGPTPASALIHAATMVASGVFFMFLVFELLSPNVLNFIAVIGCITAFFGAFVASAQKEMKKTLAYSTISQLGYMVLAIGTGNPYAALIHMMVHAFFKATLFLVSGHVIHEMENVAKALNKKTTKDNLNPNDMWMMGGLSKYMPFTFWAYLISMFAAIGMPFTTGLLSKDFILTGSVVWSISHFNSLGWFSFMIPLISFLTVGITCFYMSRQLILVFLGKPRFLDSSEKNHYVPKEANHTMLIPTLSLSVFSIFATLSPLNPFDLSDSWMLEVLSTKQYSSILKLDEIHHVHLWVTFSSLFIVMVGGAVSYFKYFRKGISPIEQQKHESGASLIKRFALNAWYINQGYESIANWLQSKSGLVLKFDTKIIDKNLNRIGKFNVAFANIILFIDKHFIDGLVTTSTIVYSGFGNIVRGGDESKIQKNLTMTVLIIIGLLILLFWVLK